MGEGGREEGRNDLIDTAVQEEGCGGRRDELGKG